MKRIVMIGMGLMLLALVAGAARAASDAAPPALQRATPTPTAVLRIPVTLAVLPLPAPVLITPTVAITATPALLATPVSIGTPARIVTPFSTPTRRTAPTPTPAQRSSPTSTLTLTPTAVADTSGGIVDFRASTSRVRGQVQLSWRYVGDPFDGDFVVERSANGGAWRYVADCSQPYDPDAGIYRCRDEGLTSGSAYEYRVCVGEAVYSCSGAPFAETDAIKAP
jgi:hypothetical protein